MDSGNVQITYGLWQYCSTYQDTQICAPLQCPNTNDNSGFCNKTLAGRVFVTLACVMSGIATICLFSCAVTLEKTNETLLLITKILAFACIIVGIIGVAVSASATQTLGQNGVDMNLGVAAILGIIAIVDNFAGAIAALSVTK